MERGYTLTVSNHRGLGGVSVTSDCFYNAGWTEDTREVVHYLRHEYAMAPLFAVGTSIGANILVKYLGEDGENVLIAGAAAICSPWDLLIGDRFISRRLVQKLHDRALTIGLQGYARFYAFITFLYINVYCRHQPQYTRLADWDGIKKSRSIRDFDNYATCLVGKFEVHTTDVAAALVLWDMCQCRYSVLVLWMTQFVPRRPFLGMSAGGDASLMSLNKYFLFDNPIFSANVYLS
ncbi:hypothetical protein CsSME_00005757 [Camellia sinensis var. sinensis]